MEIKISKGYSVIVDDIDYEWLISIGVRWCASENEWGVYAKNTRKEYMHRKIMERVAGRKLVKTEIVDHINRNT